MIHGRMQATLEGGGVIVRGPGVRGLLAVGTTSGDLLLVDPASGYKVRSLHATLKPSVGDTSCTIVRILHEYMPSVPDLMICEGIVNLHLHQHMSFASAHTAGCCRQLRAFRN